MSELEQTLGNLLNNPQMMQQLLSVAQTLGNIQPSQEAPPRQESPAAGLPQLDPGMMQKIAGMAQNTGVDPNQRALLTALGPYVSRDRVSKLEKAMRAAKMASLASAFLNRR